MPGSPTQHTSLTAAARAATHGGAPADEPNTTNNKLLFNKYELGKFLGCGGFAKVYHARDTRSGESVAVKSVSKHKILKSNLTAHVKREVAIMRRLNHPHIIRLKEVLATRSKVYFVMDYAKGGELFSKVSKGRFSEDLGRRYFRQLISAVGYCHSRGVYHRDLKPENLLIDDNYSLKVSDFGLSTFKDPSQKDNVLHTLCGTPAYVAPEILAKKGYDGAKVDIWSCGIILFVLCAGYLPFNDTNLMNLYRKIYKGEFRCPKWMSSELKRLLGRILDTNPNTRITLEEITQDAWFKKGCVNNRNNDHSMKFEFEYEDDKKWCESESGGERILNAFDLIAFSPGFSLKGLFEEEEASWRETHLAVAEEEEMVVGKIEEVARGIGAKVERVKGGKGVKVERKNGDVGVVEVVVIEVYRLTEDLVVVEVRMREGVGPSFEFWREELGPKIKHLLGESV